MTYWRIGRCIANELDAISDEKYGSKIVSTVSRQLTERYGKGYQRANLFRMLKVARVFPDEETVSTLSRQLTWIKTGAMNCNFMFVMPDDIAELWKHYYTSLPAILLFCSELFNTAVFGFFQDEVDMEFYPQRMEKMTKIMSGTFLSVTK